MEVYFAHFLDDVFVFEGDKTEPCRRANVARSPRCVSRTRPTGTCYNPLNSIAARLYAVSAFCGKSADQISAMQICNNLQDRANLVVAHSHDINLNTLHACGAAAG
jgi:hypothetical protein